MQQQAIQYQSSQDQSQTHSRISLAGLFMKARSQMSVWSNREKSRAALSRLEDWQLEDLGLTREQADAEANKLFWQE